jgi:cytosine/adenosine deaminase-related metal-dependent hydrolase
MGVLEAGAKADLIAISTDAPHFIALNDPYRQLFIIHSPLMWYWPWVDGELLIGKRPVYQTG